MAFAKPDIADFDNWGPTDIPEGFVAVEAGASIKYITGGWRSMRPIWDSEACKDCMLCWIVCPDSSIITADAHMTGIDYDHCKGCGVCVNECKFGALKMIREDEAKEA